MHTLRLEYYERQGMAVAQLRWEKMPSMVVDDTTWKGEYWANLNLSGSPTLVRSDPTLAFDWGQGAPGAGTLPSDNFSARWSRRLNFDAGTYRFHVLVDDGVRLWLDSRLILDAWSDHDSNELTVDYTMAKGSYMLKVEYYERIGNARIWVWWEKIGGPAYADWKGEYWPNRNLSGDPVLARNDRALDFDWGDGSPSTILAGDNFSARWTRQQRFEGGTYRFHAIADDGVRVWVDGRLIIDAWRDQKPAEYTKDVSITQGTHSVKVEYYEHTGGARIRIWSEKITTPSYPDWKGEYWSNRTLSGTPVLVRNDRGPSGTSSIDLNWKEGSPAAGVPKDNFSARWSRRVTFSPGRYRFYAQADDGIRVRIDERWIMDEWHASSGGTVYSADVALDGARNIVVEYYEQSGIAWMRFWWVRIGDM
jgi:hypothetical protein